MMTSLAFATLRHRKGGFVGAFVALFCAAALVCGCGMLLVTGLTGSISPERYAAAPILVSGDQNVHQTEHKSKGKVKHKAKPISDRAWVPEDLAARVAALPGVASVATEVQFPAYLQSGRGSESWGHGWESAPLGGFTIGSGRAPAAPGEVVVDATTAARLDLTVGSRLPVRTAGGTLDTLVVGITTQGLAHQTAVFFPTAQARELAAHPGELTAVGVFPAPGSSVGEVRSEVAAALKGTTAQIHSGADSGPVEFLDAANARVKLISMGAVLAATSLIVAILVVVGTFGLSIQQRQREVAMLRAVAATPKQVKRMIGGEALVVGLLAGIPGAAAGIPLGAWLHARFVALGVVPGNLGLVTSFFPVAGAALLTVGAAWVAARLSARRVVRIRPVEALGEAALSPARIPFVRGLFGVLATAGAVTLTLVLSVLDTDAASAPVSLLAALLWCTAVALLGPLIARAAVAVAGIPMRASRVGGQLAAANLRTASHRVASVITPLTLLVAMACTILFTQTTLSGAAEAQTRDGVIADHVVGGSPVPADAVADVRAVPGVQTVTEVLHSTVRTGLTKRQVQGVTAQGLATTMDLKVTSGSLDLLSPTTMAVSKQTGYAVGDQVAMALGDGTPVKLTVIAVYDRGLGFGDLTLDRSLVAAHVDVPLDDELLVSAPGVGASAIDAALTPVPGVRVVDAAAAQSASDQTGARVGLVSLGLIIAFTAIAVLNTLAMTIAGRREDFAALRLIGATRRQVLRMLRWETAAVTLVAVAIGTGVAMLVLSAYASGMTGTSSPTVPLGEYALVAGGAAVLAALATHLPARLTIR